MLQTQQNRIVFSEGGFKVAKDVAEGKAKPFTWKPINFGDGADGKKGGVGILRHGPFIRSINSNHEVYVARIGSWSFR